MIRTIAVQELRPGMYVVDTHRSWLEHSLWSRRFRIRDEAMVQRLLEDGVIQVSIDTERGADLSSVPAETASRPAPELSAASAPVSGGSPPAPAVSGVEERQRAGPLLREARTQVQGLVEAARSGRRVDAARLEPVAAAMIASVLRHPEGLIPLVRNKAMATYAADHAVATAALAIALAWRRRLAAGEMEKLALGTLVKDIGQASFDPRLTAKPGSLSRRELALVQAHVEEGAAVLGAAHPLSDMVRAVILEHHERFDGSGYPHAMAGENISTGGRMAAIVDTYDALTSQRPYRRALLPAVAVRRVFEAGGRLFDPELVTSFVRTVGIYPVGTLVRLESGHLSVVEETRHGDLLHPRVRVIFDTGRRQYVLPISVDLASQGHSFGAIVKTEEYNAWGINPWRWQSA